MGSEKGTKQRIIDGAVDCFNQHGYGKTSLQDISRHLGISRGNLTYHFPSKEELLKVTFQQMWQGFTAEQDKARALPSFQNLKNELEVYLHYQKSYSFIFMDSQVMSIPFIHRALQEMSQRTIEDNQAAIAFGLEVGNMKPEPFPGAYRQLAITTWMLMCFWLPQQAIRGTEEDPEKAVWSLILPHFSEKGVNAFKKHYGEAFYESLGPPFDQDLKDFVVL